MEKGHVYWITGLPGAGKSTVGLMLYDYLKAKNKGTVFFDGDQLREVYQFKDYTSEGRANIGKVTWRLIKLLSEQGIDIVCCFVGMVEETRRWNRVNLENYSEIYLKVDMKELIRRDQKQLYSKALNGEIENVLGIDTDFDEPTEAELVIENYGDMTPEEAFKRIVKHFNL